MVVDLSKPDEIVSIARFWFKQCQERAKEVLRSLGEDAESLLGLQGSPQCCGLPVYLLAHKCSVIKQAEPVQQNTVAYTLRALALEMGATLLYTDVEDKQSIALFRKALNHDVFGTEPVQVFVTDHKHRTLAISAGCDSEQKLSESSGGASNSFELVDRLKQVCGEKTIEQIDGAASVIEMEQYQESAVDAAREQKDQELVQYRKKCEAQARQEAALLGEKLAQEGNTRKAVAGRRRGSID